MKTPSFAHKIGESALAGVGRNNICEYLLFEMALGRHENTKFRTRNWRICTGRVVRNNICAYLLFEMALGRHENTKFFTRNRRICTGRGGQEYNMWISSIWNGFGKAWKHQVLHTKLENLHWQGWAGIMYVNIFYLKWLWQGIKTPRFAHEIGESALAGVGRNNICEYLLFEMALGRHENTKFCTRNNICEYLLFEMASGRHENTKFLHTKLENLHWQGWAGIIYVNIFYLKCLERKRPFQIEDIDYTGPKFSKQDWPTNHFQIEDIVKQPMGKQKRPFQIEDIHYTNPKFSEQDCATNHFLNRRYSVGWSTKFVLLVLV